MGSRIYCVGPVSRIFELVATRLRVRLSIQVLSLLKVFGWTANPGSPEPHYMEGNIMSKKSTVTKAQLVEAYNTIAEEPVKNFKTVKNGLSQIQSVIDEYDATEIGAVPEETRNVLAEAGIKMPEPATAEEVAKPTRKRGDWCSHCHERVYQAMIDADNKPMTKEQIKDLAGTTVAVVANAFYDFRRGDHTPEGKSKVAVGKTRENGELLYFLDFGDEEQSEAESNLQEALVA